MPVGVGLSNPHNGASCVWATDRATAPGRQVAALRHVGLRDDRHNGPAVARSSIPVDVQRMLLARCGGYCANPDCPAPDLFPAVDDDHVPTVAEMAHIIAQSPQGPRGDSSIPSTERDRYENIVLLCSTCHTLVDQMKLKGTYTVDLMCGWKRRIEDLIRVAVGIRRFDDRDELAREVAGLLRKNQGIWRNFGPESAYSEDPFSEAAPDTWRRLVRSEILPNSRDILRLIDANQHLLSEAELEIVEDFRAHVYGFAQNHLSGERPSEAPRFPPAMNDVFRPGEGGPAAA